uniref:Hypervirulence associated protein TUDOR domain-containing protein n=1 Tax=Mycena chlorophos TaxID=658473 RepID=A0ABQ0M8I0_MYCCL|nr:predicted protein [Mycena chlorophos]
MTTPSTSDYVKNETVVLRDDVKLGNKTVLKGTKGTIQTIYPDSGTNAAMEALAGGIKTQYWVTFEGGASGSVHHAQLLPG